MEGELDARKLAFAERLVGDLVRADLLDLLAHRSTPGRALLDTLSETAEEDLFRGGQEHEVSLLHEGGRWRNGHCLHDKVVMLYAIGSLEDGESKRTLLMFMLDWLRDVQEYYLDTISAEYCEG